MSSIETTRAIRGERIALLHTLKERLAFEPLIIQDVQRMNSVVSDKPYVPVPPYRGTLWPRALNLYIPRYLRRRYRTRNVEIVGAERLRASIAAGNGVLVTPNHSRDEDPFIL